MRHQVRMYLGHAFALLAIILAVLMIVALVTATSLGFGNDNQAIMTWVTVTLSLLVAASAVSSLAFTLWMDRYDRRAYALRHALRPADATESA